jgi:hypothetical protein
VIAARYHEVMVEHLTYRQTSYDTGQMLPGRHKQATLFDVGPYFDGSADITDLEEKPLVRWLMLNPWARALVLEVLRLPPDATYRCEVVEPFYAPRERDIDLILCPRLSPQLAIALDCKRVKVKGLNAEQDHVNKLGDVASGVDQANKLYNGRNAFFQTYLCIITEAEAFDAAENVPNRGVRSYTKPARGDTGRTTFRQIVEFPGRDKLHSEIGIIHLEIAQPSRLSIDSRANIRAHVYRRATSRDQPDSVTKRVIEIMQ